MGLTRLVVFSSVIVLLGGTTCLRASDDCLSCHGPSTGLTNSQGQPITVKAEGLAHSEGSIRLLSFLPRRSGRGVG